jgi:hypothetical protein
MPVLRRQEDEMRKIRNRRKQVRPMYTSQHRMQATGRRPCRVRVSKGWRRAAQERKKENGMQDLRKEGDEMRKIHSRPKQVR